MPLKLRVPTPSIYAGAFLQSEPTLGDALEAIPGFIGAFSAATLPLGDLATWPAEYGAGSFVQATDIRRPTVVDAEGARGVRNVGTGRNMVLSQTLTSGAALTVGLRFFLPAGELDFSTILGPQQFRLYYRTAGTLLFNNTSTAVTSRPIAPGWHTAMVMQSTGTTARLHLDGQEATGTSLAGAQITELVLGALSIAGAANSFLGPISKVFVASSDVQGTAGKDYALQYLSA